MNFSKKCFKQQKSIDLLYVAQFGEKKFLLIFVPFYLFDQIHLFKQSKFHRICPFSNVLKKTLPEYFSAPFRQSLFWLKREDTREFLRKCFKTTERHRLAVRGSLWGEKKVFINICPFYWFYQKKLFKLRQIFIRIYLFQTCLLKQTFWVFQWSFLT